MSSVTPPTLWSTVVALPDYLLLAQTRQLARHEQALQILVLDHLREIEARRLHLTRGYGSLFDYVVHELGYTAAAAWRRIKAMRLCSQTSGARELLQDGSLNLSNAAQLQNLFERSDRSRGRPPASAGAGGTPGGAPRDDGTPGNPAPATPMRAGERDQAPVAGPVLDAAAREDLVKQAAGKSTRELQQMLAEVDPELAQPSDRMRALGSGRWALKATIDAECRHGLEKLQMLLSHQDPHLTLGGLVARLVRGGLDRYDPARPPRVQRTDGRRSEVGERTESKPARRDKEAGQRTVAGAERNEVERRSAVAHDDAPPVAAVPAGAPGLSATKRQTEGERGSTKSTAVRGRVHRADSAPKRPSEVKHGSASPATSPRSGGHTASPAKRHGQAEPGSTSRAAARDSGGWAISAPKRDTETEHGGAKCAAVRDVVRRSDSAPKRVTQDEAVRAEEAERLCAAADSVPGRRPKAEYACGQPNAMGGSGRPASPAKRHWRAERDGPDAGVGDVPDRATCAAGPRFEADRSTAAQAPVRGGRRSPTWAAKRLAYAAGHGAVASAKGSPALDRHLAALSCFGTVPGSRSRYIPAAVRREVCRRDEGCCSYVDRDSGRRCGSRYRLEIDHIVPFALGGANECSNLRLRCGAHHKLRHAQRHARGESAVWTPSAPVSGSIPGNAVGPSDRKCSNDRAGT